MSPGEGVNNGRDGSAGGSASPTAGGGLGLHNRRHRHVISHTSNGPAAVAIVTRDVGSCAVHISHLTIYLLDRSENTHLRLAAILPPGSVLSCWHPVPQPGIEAWSHAICSAENRVGTGGVVGEIGPLVDIFRLTETT